MIKITIIGCRMVPPAVKRMEGEPDWNKLPPPYPRKKFRYDKRMLFVVYGMSAFYSFWFLYNMKKHYWDREHHEPMQRLPNGPLYWFKSKGYNDGKGG